VELTIRKNGSTLVVGDVVLKDQDGNVITPPSTPFALCRCGASNKKFFATDRTNASISTIARLLRWSVA